MPQYKLYYFGIYGLGEPIRLCFAQAGVPFEDVRLTTEEWQQQKQKMPFGQLPVLEIDGKKRLTQSAVILRYLGKKYGLEGEDEWERTVGDELATSWYDFSPYMLPVFNETDKELKKQKALYALDEFFKPRLLAFNERVGELKTLFLAGNKATWCDFCVYTFLVMIRDFLKFPLQPYPHVIKLLQKIESLPKVKEWQAKHPNTPWSTMPSPFD